MEERESKLNLIRQIQKFIPNLGEINIELFDDAEFHSFMTIRYQTYLLLSGRLRKFGIDYNIEEYIESANKYAKLCNFILEVLDGNINKENFQKKSDNILRNWKRE